MSWFRFARAVLASLIVLCMSMFFFAFMIAMMVGIALIALIVAPGMIAENRKWKQKLQAQGRLVDPATDSSHFRTGTLIVDSYSQSESILRCWWTADAIRAICPFEIKNQGPFQEGEAGRPNLVSPYETWVYQNYTHPEKGSAVLLAEANGDLYAGALMNACPNLDVIFTWSAFVSDSEPANRPVITIEHYKTRKA